VAAITKINDFMSRIGRKGGMSLTTGFDVNIKFKNPSVEGLDFCKNYYSSTDREVVNMLCDEAQLPNVQSAVNTISGRYLGEGSISYPHTRIFTDVGLGFMCDAELIPLKFFSGWYEYIFGESRISTTYKPTMEPALGVSPKATQRTNRVTYIDDYVANVKIIKSEAGPGGANARVPVVYILENAYPYAIDAVPLAYGSSQLTRVNVNLYYTRHTVAYGK